MLCSARKKGKGFLFSSHFLSFVGGWINFQFNYNSASTKTEPTQINRSVTKFNELTSLKDWTRASLILVGCHYC